MKNGSNKPPLSVFLSATMVIFVLTLSAADSIGFVPYYIDGTEPTRSKKVAIADLPELGETPVRHLSDIVLTPKPTPAPVVEVGVKPDRMRIASIGLDLPVFNPETRDIPELEETLKNGPARYVDSAELGVTGNVLIFGHSSHLPVVHNQMYKAFNRIPDLKGGSIITVEGGGKEFIYSVTSIKQVDANEGVIDLSKEGKKLTIVTCDTLTSKSSRFVLEAELIGSYEI